MIDREKLIKALEQHCDTKADCNSCPYEPEETSIKCRDSLLCDCLEALKKPQWISVKDRLPDSAGASVIVTAVNRFGQVSVFTAFQGYGDFKWYTMETTKMDDDTCNMVSSNWTITHWMPLPEPPEEE